VFRRQAEIALKRLARGFPVVVLTAPTQSGKTTLAQALFGKTKPYVSLENPAEREFAERDPERFLLRLPEGAILDEVQRSPSLLLWLQGLVDARRGTGDFILTGSAQFESLAGLSQSLAGRGALFETFIVSEFLKQRYNAGEPAPALLLARQRG
jgi:uncharacterized protein